MPAIEVLDLFSAAAGGWSLGMHRAGYKTIAACEFVDWRRALYQQNNPGVRIYDDVRTLTADQLVRDLGRLPAVIVGSPPCQDISSANTKGKGVDGARSGLYFEAIRIIGEIRDLGRERGEVAARWFALENSSNLRTRGADTVLAALEALGYTCWSFVVRAGDIGANHERPRCWIIGCDVEQVADPDGLGWYEGRGRRRGGLNLSVSQDPFHSAGFGHESRRPWGHRTDGDRSPPASSRCARDPSHSNEARSSHGQVVTSVRSAQVPDDGRGLGRGDDGQSSRQVGVCEGDRVDPASWRSDWSLDDLAGHLQLDDGLSAWLAGTRIAVGGPRGTSAASLIVEAFGDAVVPQIPEAIGRAILRTERALDIAYGRAA